MRAIFQEGDPVCARDVVVLDVVPRSPAGASTGVTPDTCCVDGGVLRDGSRSGVSSEA